MALKSIYCIFCFHASPRILDVLHQRLNTNNDNQRIDPQPTAVNQAILLRFRFDNLKLYCGFLYTSPCIINRIWGLNNYDYRWMIMFDFICMGSTYLFGTARRERKAQNENICLQRDSNPRLATTRLVEKRFRPLGYDTLMKIWRLMSYWIVG